MAQARLGRMPGDGHRAYTESWRALDSLPARQPFWVGWLSFSASSSA
jgi:hypothetical protein